jgi:hypothetical protein
MSVKQMNPFMMSAFLNAVNKISDIEQYLNTNNFSVNNRHVVIKSSQATQLYIATVIV